MAEPKGGPESASGSHPPRTISGEAVQKTVWSPLAGQLVSELSRYGVSSVQAHRRYVEVMVRFLSFLDRGFGVTEMADVTSVHVEAFVLAPIAGTDPVREPSVATAHLRRCVVRLLFRILRDLETVSGDPTLDLRLPPKSTASARPLDDDEVTLCRSSSLRSPNETRLPAAWALAEASARTSEIANVVVGDLDLSSDRLWLRGGTNVLPRWGYLTGWGRRQLERRLHELGSNHVEQRLIYTGKGSGASAQAASCMTISKTMWRAGLHEDADLRPTSVTAWAGVQVMQATKRIEEVARRLGMRSLDRTARLIAWDWRPDELQKS